MIVGITGDLGSGKTLFLTYALYSLYFKKGWKVFSNYKLSFKHNLLTNKMIENLFLEKQNLDKKVFGIDEIHIYMDSRVSGSKKNRLMSYWILQTRKRNVDLLWTSQFFTQPDKRLRDITNFQIKCYNLGDKNNPFFYYVLHKRVESGDKDYSFVPIREFYLRNPEFYFKLYDTYEIIDFNDDK